MERYGKEKRFQFGFDARELALFIGGIAVICALFFVFGMTVGKSRAVREAESVSPGRIAPGGEEGKEPVRAAEVKELLQEAVQGGKGAEEPPRPEEQKKEEDGRAGGLTFYDTLPNKGEGSAGEAPIQVKDEAAEKPAGVAKRAATGEKKETAATVRVEAGKPAPAAPEERGKLGSLYAVQVSSFRDWGHAMALKKRLIGAGYRAYVTQAEGRESETWFRVRVGDFQGKREAEEMARKIGLEEKLPAFAVPMGGETR